MEHAHVRQPGLKGQGPESTWESDLCREGDPTVRRLGSTINNLFSISPSQGLCDCPSLPEPPCTICNSHIAGAGRLKPVPRSTQHSSSPFNPRGRVSDYPTSEKVGLVQHSLPRPSHSVAELYVAFILRAPKFPPQILLKVHTSNGLLRIPTWMFNRDHK